MNKKMEHTRNLVIKKRKICRRTLFDSSQGNKEVIATGKVLIDEFNPKQKS